MTKRHKMILMASAFLTLWGLIIVAFSANAFAQEKEFSIQVYAYLTPRDAQTEVNRLKAKQLDAYWVKAEIPGIGTRYRVRIGRYSDPQAANQGATQVCNTRVISQYMIAEGSTVPTGVKPLTCANLQKEIATASSNKAAKSDVSSVPVKLNGESASVARAIPTTLNKPKTELAAIEVKNLKIEKRNEISKTPELPVAVSIQPNKALPKSSPKLNLSINNVRKAMSSTIALVEDSPKPPKIAKGFVPTKQPLPAEQKQNPVNANTASGPVLTRPNMNTIFEPADRPLSIVLNAHRFAVARVAPVKNMGEPLKEKLSSASTEAAPNNNSEISISNPKWKVSQNSGVNEKNLRAVYFVDAWTGWAAGEGGTIYQTNDGGKQWNQIRSAALAGKVVDVNRIYFINENKGWMLADTRTKKDDEPQSVLLSTDDGGQIWQHINMPNISSFYFVNEKKGWAVGKNATMLRTVDGGLKWKPVTGLSKILGLPVESAASNFGFSDIYFLNSEIGWAVGNFYGKSTVNIGGLFMTIDGGESWQRIPIAIQRKTNSSRFTKGKLQSVRFTDVSNGIITGEMEDGEEKFSFTLKTYDGGETWEQTRVPSNTIQTTQFIDAARGWTATAALQKNTDGLPSKYDTILSHTNNGGKSWETDVVARGNQIRSVFFISPNRGWAVGDRGMILRYDAQ